MTLARPAFLLLLLALPPLWVLLRRYHAGGARRSLLLKSAVFAAAVLALAEPWAELAGEKIAVTVAIDTSASMSPEARAGGAGMLRELVRRNSGAELRRVDFAERAQAHPVASDARRITTPPAAADGNATDVERALHLALSTMPARGARRVLLVSDGNETRGRALSAALRAREQGIPVYTLAPQAGGSGTPALFLESVRVPQQVLSGERFTVSLKVTSSRPASTRISLMFQNRVIGSSPVKLEAGANQVDVDARITGTGVSVLEGRATVLDAAGAATAAERSLFSQAISVRPPRVLYVYGGGPPPVPGSGGAAYLADTLRRAQVEVETATSFSAEAAADRWDAVIMDNYPDHRLSGGENQALEKFVSGGGGLVFIAGPANARIAEEPREPFEKMLPVRGDPQPAPDETTAVVLVLDKSASMDGLKIAMAREAARASLVTLRPVDKIGVLAFDSSHRWVVPLAMANDIARISSLISTISADGGTSIYPALSTAYQSIRSENAARKHIILLTDGWSTPGEFAKLAQDAAAERITISTVGVGKEVNRTLLENVAREARGKSYFVENPETVPQIISGEVRELSASPVRERAFRPTALRPVEFTDGVDFSHAPKLLGFVKTKARDGSETILRTDTGEPLLARWQFGLGRVMAFMSDARNRWAAEWLAWKAYGTLWPQMVRDACRGARTVSAGVRPGEREGEAVVYYHVAMDAAAATGGPRAHVARAAERPRVIVASAGEPSRSVPLEETAPGHFEARILAGQRGLYRIVSGTSELLLPEAGFFQESDELRQREPNLALLEEISRVSGGSYAPTAELLLSSEGALVKERQPLWPWFLLLALALNFVELAIRRGSLASAAAALRPLSARLLRNGFAFRRAGRRASAGDSPKRSSSQPAA